MKQFIAFVIKEAKHILRDKRTMLILFGMPVVMMLLFGFAITTDVKNVRTVVVTSEMSPRTQQAVERLAQSEYFIITQTVKTPKDAEQLIRSQKADMALVFARNRGLQIMVDGSDPNMAQQWTTYAQQTMAAANSCVPSVASDQRSSASLFTLHSSLWVADCTLESDLEMYFPDQYVPKDSERMLLYRELDNMRNDKELEAYRQRLIDRFGPIPDVAEELIRVVPLRRYGKELGCEKIMLKQGRMFLYFVSNPNSPFYQSETFGNVINYATANVRRCNLRETSAQRLSTNGAQENGKRSMVVTDVPTVQEALSVMKSIVAE